MTTRLRSRAIALIVVAALLPLAVLGAMAILRARITLLDEAQRANTELARRAADEIARHVARYDEVLGHLAALLDPTLRLTEEQQARMLRNQRIDLLALQQLDYLGKDGRVLATGRVSGLDEAARDRSHDPAVQAALAGRTYHSAVHVSDDLVPQMVIGVPQRIAGRVTGAVVATVDLTEIWKVVDGIRVGEHGFARVVGEDGTLLAVGNNLLKRRVFTQQKDDSGAIVTEVLAGRPAVMRYQEPVPSFEDTPGRESWEVLAVGQPIPSLGWGILVEQPVAEALASYGPFRALILAIAVLLLAIAALLGWLGARSVVKPIEKLRRRAGEIARGVLDARVEVDSPEELHALAVEMNQMCQDLIRLQDDVRKQERIATLGRLAAGLAHDLKHPIRALQVAAGLVVERPESPEARRLFRDVVAREFQRLERFLDDLKRASRDEPRPIEASELDLAELVRRFADEQQSGSKPAYVDLVIDGAAEQAPTRGDAEQLERVLANLASNAYEAMEGEGTLRLTVSRTDDAVELRVADTGCGIAPERIAGLFNDFDTTKRRGLGLGLPVCRKIVADHGGSLTVESEPGRGATFVLRLPASPGAALHSPEPRAATA